VDLPLKSSGPAQHVRRLPFLPWIATATSACGLVLLWRDLETSEGWLAVLSAWFAAGLFCQFFVSSAVVSAIGLALQTLLAIAVVVRIRSGT